LDARYCALSRISFGLIAGSAGVGSGDIPRATARPTQPPQPSLQPGPVVGTSVTSPGSLCGWARCRQRWAGQARPGRSLSSAIGPGPLVRPEPVVPPAPSQYSASVRGRLPTSLLSPLAGVGHCPLAIGHGPSACRGCSSACWIAGPYRHCRRAVGRIRAGTVAGGSPSAPFCRRVRRSGAGPRLCAVRWAVTVVADCQRCAAAPVTGTPGWALPVSWSEQPCGGAFGQRQSVPIGPSAARVKLTARSSWEPRRAAMVLLPQSTGYWPAHSRQVVLQSGARPATAIRPGRHGPGCRATLDSEACTGGPGARSDHGP
jgi:hypothetical protein